MGYPSFDSGEFVMNIKIELMDSFCDLRVFVINGVQAYKEDFGNACDESPDNADDYGCGDMVFTPHEYPPAGVLSKYDISREEFDLIAAGLAKQLSFGGCGLCV